MKKARVLIFAIALTMIAQSVPITAYAGNATDMVCEKIESDYYYKITQETKAKIEKIRKSTMDEETAIAEIARCLDKHSEYYSKEYCESLSSSQAKKNVYGFETIDSAYIKIDTFDSSCGEEFDKMMNSLSSEEKDLYIDLSDCGGGFITTMLKIAEWVLPQGTVCTAKFKNSEEVYTTKNNEKYNPKRKVHIIVSKSTASAAEILAGAVQLHGSGTVIGTESTYGKTSIQELVLLPTGGILKITVGEYLIGTDYNISKTGLNPEMLVKENN